MDVSQDASRKRKRNAERARVTRACDRCKKRKSKCNGVQPCDICQRAEAECTFDTAYARGRAPRIVSVHGELDGTESVRDATPGNPHLATQEAPPVLPSLSPSMPADSPSSPKSSRTGLHGQYIGPASGVSFLQRVQKRLGETTSFSHPGNIFTFGDPPYVEPDVSSSLFMMVPREVTQQLVDRYFDFAMPTYRFLHKPTIQKWFAEFYDTFGMMRDAQRAPAKIALLLMVFAHGRVYMPDDNRPGPPDLSKQFYLAAERQLAKESGSIRLTSIQARLTQCYYLLTQSRINHCWSNFGTVTQLALAAGLNRSKKSGPFTEMSNKEIECRRRTFWCAYTLDVHLSVVLGRPQLFHDDDLDVELPMNVDDEYLTDCDHVVPSLSGSSTTMFASLAHVKLARIVKQALRSLYPLKPISSHTRTSTTERIHAKLAAWHADLASFLDTESFNASMFLPIVQRQRNVLNLTYWHAVTLTHRPFLLNNFTSRQNGRAVSEGDNEFSEQQMVISVKHCLESAMQTVTLISHMTLSGQMSRAFWIAAYFAFTAITVLYIYVIQIRWRERAFYDRYLTAATLCQSHISSIAETGSLSERYCLLLEELRLEASSERVSSQRPRLRADNTANGNIENPLLANFGAESGSVRGPYANVEGGMGAPSAPTGFDGLFATGAPDYQGWDQFASMLTSGVGNLDSLVCGDLFGGLNEFAPS